MADDVFNIPRFYVVSDWVPGCINFVIDPNSWSNLKEKKKFGISWSHNLYVINCNSSKSVLIQSVIEVQMLWWMYQEFLLTVVLSIFFALARNFRSLNQSKTP